MTPEEWSAKVDRNSNDPSRIEARKGLEPSFIVPRHKTTGETMEEKFTPSEQYLCERYIDLGLNETDNFHDPEAVAEELNNEFLRALNKIKADAVRNASNEVRASSFWNDGSDNYASRVRGWLGWYADKIEEDTDETP